MTMDVERIKDANKIEDVINETHPLRMGVQRYLKGQEHDSLVVDTSKQYYVWNSQGHQGDVINWLETMRKFSFRQAVEYLADRAGIPVNWSGQETEAWKATRIRQDVLSVIAEFLQGKLGKSDPAAAYIKGRGWDTALAKEAGLGFWDGDRQGLIDYLKLHEIDPNRPEVIGVLGFTGDVESYCQQWKLDIDVKWLKSGRIPGLMRDMLVYCHYVGNKVTYLSGRSIAEKRHYNLPATLVNGKQPYWNQAYSGRAEHVVVVEGQADAVSLGSWGIAAVALAGLNDTPTLLRQLERHEFVYVALDKDAAGNKAIRRLAEGLGPTTKILAWPSAVTKNKSKIEVKDANDWLIAGGTGAQCRELMRDAAIYAEWLAIAAAAAESLMQEKMRKEAIEAIADLPEYVYEERKKSLAKALDIGVTELNGMVKALKKERDKNSISHKIEVTLANGQLDDHLFEMVYDPHHEKGPRTAFAVRYPDGHYGITPRLDTESYSITPFDPYDSLLRMGVVRMPSAIGKYKNEVELQGRIQEFIHKYVDLPEHIERLASYYVMMTWVYDCFYVVPYLRARGDSDSGKSRFTEVVGEICMRSMFVTGSTTPSPVFRTMTRWNGLTVVMDEADLPHTETSGDWLQMFNTGYKDSFAILRSTVKNGEVIPEAFSGFGPKIINMRGRFTDDATESRCLTWETSSGRGIREDIPRYMDRETFMKEALELRNCLLAFRLRNQMDVVVDYNHENTRQLPGRLVEITVPLMSISNDADFKGGVMQFINRMNDKAIMDRQDTLVAKVLLGILHAYYLPDSAVRDMPESHQEQMKLQVAHITRQTNRIINRENAEASLIEDGEFTSVKELRSGTIGKILKNDLNLETANATVGTKAKIVQWDFDRINSLVVRYGYEDVVMELANRAIELQEANPDMGDDAENDPSQGELNL